MLICPCVWDLRKPGRDVENSDLELKADSENWLSRFSQESYPTASLFRISHSSCVRLPAYPQHLLFSIHLELPSFFWKEKMAVAIEISHGRYWEKLESVTLTSDPFLP